MADGNTAQISPLMFGANDVSAPVSTLKAITFARGSAVPGA